MSALSRPTIEEEPRPRSIWRNRDYLILWWGQVASSVGTQVSQLAFPLLILAVTHSPALTGLLTALRSVPFILLSLPSGALADRWDRKRVMIISDTGRAIAMGSIPLALVTGHLTLLQLAVASLVEGTLFTFFNVAESASLPTVVGKAQLPEAVAMSSTTDSVSLMAGPTLGGLLYALGSALPFVADTISYATSVISLLFIRTSFQAERKAGGDLRAEIREGIVWLWRHPLMRFLAIYVSGLNLFSFGYPLIMIVRAQSMHASPGVIGLLFATGGVGSLIGSVLVAPLQRRFRFGQLMIGAGWLWALTWLPYALAPNIVSLGAANVLGWLMIPIFMGSQYGYRLAATPDALQGRVNSVFKLIAFGGDPISLALTGVLLQFFGPITTILIVFVPQIVLAGVATMHPGMRRAGYLREVARNAA